MGRRRSLLALCVALLRCCSAAPLHGAALEAAVAEWRSAEYELQVSERRVVDLEGHLRVASTRHPGNQTANEMSWDTDEPAEALSQELAREQGALQALRPRLEALRAAMDETWPPGARNATDAALARAAAVHSPLGAHFQALAHRPHPTAPLPGNGPAGRPPFRRRYNITFVVEYFKHPRNIDAIVDSLAACQSPSLTSELVVNVDSRGDAAAWEEAMTRTATRRGGWLTVLLSSNLHEVHGYNRAAAVARGDVLVLLQDDALPPASCAWVGDVLRAFAAFPRLGALGLNIAEFWYPYDTFRDVPTGRLVNKRTMPHDIMYRHQEVPFQFVTVADFSPYAVRAAAFHHVGGMDEGLALPGECGIFTDYELSMRMWASGWQVAQMRVRGGLRAGEGVGGTHASEKVGLQCWDKQQQLNSRVVGLRYSKEDSRVAFEQVKALNAGLERAFEGPPLWEQCCDAPGKPLTGNSCESCSAVRAEFAADGPPLL